MTVDILYDFPINIGGCDFIMDIVIADVEYRYDFPVILGRGFFAQSGLIQDAEQGRTIIRTLENYQVFVVTYPGYDIDVSQTPQWLLLKSIVDDYARRGVEEEIATGYMTEEENDSEDDQEEIKEPEGRKTSFEQETT